jgi:hypothetical protein
MECTFACASHDAKAQVKGWNHISDFVSHANNAASLYFFLFQDGHHEIPGRSALGGERRELASERQCTTADKQDLGKIRSRVIQTRIIHDHTNLMNKSLCNDTVDKRSQISSL